MNCFPFIRSKTACCRGEFDDALTVYTSVSDAVENGIECFLFNAETESGLLFAKQVLLRKKKQKGNKADKINLVAVISSEHFADDRDEQFRNEYFDVMSQCDDVLCLRSDGENATDKFLISKSGLLI